MAVVKLKLDWKDPSWVTGNTTVLEADELVMLTDGTFARADGVTQVKDLTFLGGAANAAWGSITGTLSSQTDLQAALDAKASSSSLSSHIADTSNPHGVTKSQVGLSNVDNTSDANKPVSTAQQTALDAKQDRISELLTGGVITVETIDGTGTLNDIRVTASTYYIEGSGQYSAAQTIIYNFSLAPSGQFYYIGIYGTTSGTITSVNGTAGAAAVPPSTPANTVLFKYVIVNDSGASVAPDLSGYLLTSDYRGLGLAFHWTTFNPLDGVLYYIGTAGLAMSATTSTPHAIAPITGVIYAAYITTRNNTVNSTEPSTFTVEVNGVVSTLTTHIFNSTPPCQKYVSGLNIPITAGDPIYVRMLAASWVTNPTNTAGWVYLLIR